MKFKLAAAALALAILLSLGVARATGWPSTHTRHDADRVVVQPVSVRPSAARPPTIPQPAPSADHAVPIGGTTAACAVLLATILLRRVTRRR